MDEDIASFLGTKAIGEQHPYSIMRRACVSCTALLSLIVMEDGVHNMRTVSLGDSDGCKFSFLFKDGVRVFIRFIVLGRCTEGA